MKWDRCMQSARRVLDRSTKSTCVRKADRRYQVALRKAADAEEPEYAEGLTLKALAELDAIGERFGQAAERYREARRRLESCREPEHPRILGVIEALAGVCRQVGRDSEALELEAVLGKRWNVYPLAGGRDRALRSRGRCYGGEYFLDGIDLMLHPLPDRTRLVEATGSPLLTAVCHLARWYRVRGWFDMAEEVYRHTLALGPPFQAPNPLRREAMAGLVELLEETGRGDEALQFTNELRTLRRVVWNIHEVKRIGDTGRLAWALLAEARDFASVSATDEALRCAQQLLALEPSKKTRREAQAFVANIFLRQGRFQEAEDAGRRLLEDDPDNFQHHLFLGYVFEKRALPVEAARCYLEAARVSDNGRMISVVRLHRLVGEHPHVHDVPGVDELISEIKGFISYSPSPRGPDLF